MHFFSVSPLRYTLLSLYYPTSISGVSLHVLTLGPTVRRPLLVTPPFCWQPWLQLYVRFTDALMHILYFTYNF